MQNNMKFFKTIIPFLAAAGLALGCSGTVDDSTLPVLAASSAEIDLADAEPVEFTVTYDGVDVTADSEIFLNSQTRTQDSWGPTFMPEETGSYTFSAMYNGRESNSVTINVINTVQSTESKYERHVCLMEFTGAWCLPCYHGYNNMMEILSKPSMAKYSDRIHIAAFHSDSGGTDVMAIPESDVIFNLVKGVAYPTFAVDLRDSGALTDDGKSLLQPGLMASLNEAPRCGIAVSSELGSDKTKANVTAKVTSEQTSDYRVVILVVEDKIVGPQKTTTYPEGQKDYIHKHVVRDVVTSYVGTFTGEKITDDGEIKAGGEASKSWTITIDDSWKLQDTAIYALVLDEEGHVNNMNVCPIQNGNSGYNLKK